jgi:hypothetical protein
LNSRSHAFTVGAHGIASELGRDGREGPAGDACSWEVAPDSHLEPSELVGAVINVAITGRCVDATIVSHV